MQRVVQIVTAALVLSLVLLVGGQVIGGITAGQDGLRTQQSAAALLSDTSTYTTIDDGDGFDETVYNSRGHAVNLSGRSDSYVESNDDFEIATDDTWTISVWAYVDQGAGSETMTAVSANGRVIINYNGTDGNWTAWYYDEGSTNSYQVNVSAPNQPGNLTNVMVASNSTHLAIRRNNSTGDVKDITTSNIADAPVTATNWDGRLDEVRTFDDDLNGSQRESVVNDSVGPVPSANRTSRIMFDQPNKTTQFIFFTNTRLRQSNVTYSQGLDGQQMTPKDALMGQADYEWRITGPKIRPVAGGELEGAPVAYVDYTFEDALADLLSGWSGMVAVAALVPVVAVAAVIVTRLREAQ